MQSGAFPHLEHNKEVRESVRALCSKFPAEYWDQHDRDHEYAADFVKAFADGGFLGILIPEEYGGGGGTIAEFCAALEEVAASGGALNACSSVHVPLLCVPSILAFGTEEQRRTLLPEVAAGRLLITFGVTEPDAGTDTTRIGFGCHAQGPRLDAQRDEGLELGCSLRSRRCSSSPARRSPPPVGAKGTA